MICIKAVITKQTGVGQEVTTLEVSGEDAELVASDYNRAMGILNPSIEDLAHNLAVTIESSKMNS